MIKVQQAGTTDHSHGNTKADKNLPGSMFGHFPFAVYTCDASGYIDYFNQAAIEIWGWKPEPGKTRFWETWTVLQPGGEPLPPQSQPMSKVLKQGIAAKGGEMLVRRRDGELFHVQTFPVPLFDDEGILTGAIDTLINITGQIKDEGKEAMLAAIIESSDDAIVSKTLNGIITSWNPAAEKMFGFAAQEMIGSSITRIIPHNRLAEEQLIIGKIKNGEKVDHYETYRQTKSGAEIPVSLTISPVRNRKGQVIGASKIARNIAKQKAAEESLQQYAENLEVLNAVGKIISGNLDVAEILQKVTDATTELTNADFGAFFYNKQDEQGGSYTLFALSGAPREAFEKFGMPRNTAVFAPTFKGEGVVRVDDITKDPRYGKNAPNHGMPEGHLPVISYLAVPVISKSGAVIGGLFFGHKEAGRFTVHHEKLVLGVSNQAAVALDNAQLYGEIQKLNSKKDEFIGLASHELKTPITSLSGYLQIMDRRLPEGDPNKAYLKKALHQIGKLSDLISDLLDVSKIEAGQLQLTFSRFDLHHLVEEVVELMQYSTKTHKLNLYAAPGELLITADKQRMEQVIINLISNAVKYSPKGDVVNITISIAGIFARVAVQDMGLGISKEQQARIFSRFYRVEELASHISGLGLGLYISKDIVERHKGNLWVESEPGKGSTFYFELPLS